MKLFKFSRDGVDEYKDGKITSYKDILVVAEDEQSARIKAKRKQDLESGLSEQYTLVRVYPLSKDWR